MKTKKEKTNPIDLFLGILFAWIVVLIFTQVLFRYLLNSSLNWTEELAKYLFVWMTFIGAAAAFKDRMLIGVDFFVQLLPAKYRRLADWTDVFLVTAFSLIATVLGYIWTYDVWGTLSPALELPLALLLYAAFPTASAIICIVGIRRLLNNDLSNDREEEETAL
ncbi:MAG: TRAP transporter small permease [Dysgonamonadaceae bacterium]|jgi:TRAP-type C4-dicarboxylate transport system permease small subunit|nr:TRAP transporter small permease [Dysgonamonadaceae bacterium]